MTWLVDTRGNKRAGAVAVYGLGVAFFVCAASGLRADSRKGMAGIVNADICTLSAHPKRFRNRVVRFRARVWVGVEGACLLDKASKCTVGIQLPQAARNDPDISAALAKARRAFGDVTGTVTGELLVKRRHHRPVPIVSIIKITDLKVTPWKLAPKR